MTDCVHLYVFDCQNFVSEKDYRAVLEQRRGFENAALDNETAAKKAKEQLAACRREFFEYRKVAWENEEIGHKALDDLQRAREAGRREGLELHKEAWGALNFILAFNDSDANRYLDTNAWKRAEASGRRVRAKLRALIDSPKASAWDKTRDQDALCACGHPYYRHFDTYEDMRSVGCKYCECMTWDSPKAEGEKPPKMLYVAFDCLGNPYAVSTRPEHIACDPARIKPYVPVEAEGEEPDGK